MCLIKDMDQVMCSHPTCLRAMVNPEFFTHTKRAVFENRKDFNRIRLRRNAENVPTIIGPSNPHKQHTESWKYFNSFQECCTFRATGGWPNGAIFQKSDIEIQFYLYARRLRGAYSGLRDEYEYSMVLDVEEGAVYIGSKPIV